VIIFILGRIAFKVLPGEPMSLIMEMPPYHKPHARTVLKETWMRVKDFIYIAFPLIIIGSVVLSGLGGGGVLEPIENALSPVTVGWLGLPAITGVLLIFGVLRKELTLVMLATSWARRISGQS
jgi:ferrous iron transport protein B